MKFQWSQLQVQSIGKGKDNDTYLCWCPKNNIEIVAKRFALCILYPVAQIKNYLDSLIKLKVDRMANLLDYQIQKQILIVYEEYCRGGTLELHRRRQSTNSLTPQKLMEQFKIVLEELAILEEQGMANSQLGYKQLLLDPCLLQLKIRIQPCYKPIVKPRHQRNNIKYVTKFAQAILQALLGPNWLARIDQQECQAKQFWIKSKILSFRQMFQDQSIKKLQEHTKQLQLKVSPVDIYKFIFDFSDFLISEKGYQKEGLTLRFYIMIFLRQEISKLRQIKTSDSIPCYFDTRILLNYYSTHQLHQDFAVLEQRILGTILQLSEFLKQNQIMGLDSQIQFSSIKEDYKQFVCKLFDRIKSDSNMDQIKAYRLLVHIIISRLVDSIFNRMQFFEQLGLIETSFSSLKQRLREANTAECMRFLKKIIKSLS